MARFRSPHTMEAKLTWRVHQLAQDLKQWGTYTKNSAERLESEISKTRLSVGEAADVRDTLSRIQKDASKLRLIAARLSEFKLSL